MAFQHLETSFYFCGDEYRDEYRYEYRYEDSDEEGNEEGDEEDEDHKQGGYHPVNIGDTFGEEDEEEVSYEVSYGGSDEDGNEGVERIEDYTPGGYHPVHLGDTFPTRDSPRYRVLHKLGHGAFATVWFAKDLVANRCVALKIVVARLTGDKGESALLRWLNARPHDHPGAGHVVQLFDSFEIHGPNRTHQVLVMDIVQPFYLVRGTDAVKQQSQSICRQLLLGLAYLQQEAVMHGDLHTGNIGFKIRGIEQFTEERMLQFMGEPELTVVLPRDLSAQSDSLPKYLVSDSNIGNYTWSPSGIVEVQLFAQIFGFGRAFRLQDYRPLPETPCFTRAPELTFYELSDGQVEKEWGLPSDVWSMACTIFKIEFNEVMVSGANYINEMVKLVGPLPERWKPYLDQKPFKDSDGNFTIDPDAAWPRRLGWSVRDTDNVKNKEKTLLPVPQLLIYLHIVGSQVAIEVSILPLGAWKSVMYPGSMVCVMVKESCEDEFDINYIILMTDLVISFPQWVWHMF